MPIDAYFSRQCSQGMFERYTEKARRMIFFARYEASQFGSSVIETEHLLLGLLREEKDLALRFLAPSEFEEIRREIESAVPPRDKVDTSVDLPLSKAAKRTLVYAAEEAKRFDHGHIGGEHLLIGLTLESESLAARLLLKRGIDTERLRREIPQIPIVQPPRDDRESLHLLVNKLPESELSTARRVLESLLFPAGEGGPKPGE